MNRVFILGGRRSHIGSTNGVFKNTLPEDLGGRVLKDLILEYKISKIDEIICGNTIGPGGNIARLTALKAGVSEEIPAFTIDMQCGSGSKAIDIATSKIKCGEANLIIVGGIESTSTRPIKEYNKNDFRYNGENTIFNSAQFSPNEIGDNVMLEGAERVVKKYNISKEELDYWVVESHKRASIARREGRLNKYITEVNGSYKDEIIRENINSRLLKRLRPLVYEHGKINSGNTTLTSDGAGFLILVSDKYLKENNEISEFEILDKVVVGGNPLYSPVTANKATEKLLIKNSLVYSEISAFEYNEAFAVIDVLFQRKNPELIHRYNRFGGALAYGHPYGASGIIIMIHLMESIKVSNGNLGISAIASAGGLGTAVLIKRVM